MKSEHSKAATLWTTGSMDNWSDALDSIELSDDVESKIAEAVGLLNEVEILDRLRSFDVAVDQDTLKKILR